MKKVVFILGAARSGSTLLDIVLGNGPETFSCGEMIIFPKRRGIPHGGAEVPEREDFWQRVGTTVCDKSGMDYATLETVADKIEHHAYFLNHAFSLYAPSAVERYSTYINLMFDTVFELSGKNILIDSSKRPSRALALNKFLHYDIYIIYLIKNPVEVIRSFSKKDVEQASKSWFSANLYYFIANAFSCVVGKKFPKERFLTIYYENLLEYPVEQLALIEDRFSIDLSIAKERIQFNQPLDIGHIFDGNRIRMQESLVLNRHVKFTDKQSYEFITSSLNRFWWNKKLKMLSREMFARAT